MIAVAVTFLGALGLAIGSFLNVVAYRVPNGLSVVSPPSACPGCESQIRNRDNVPVLSWLLLRGRCRECDMRISARYPLVEAITGMVFVGISLVFAPAVFTAATAREAAVAGVELAALLYLGTISVVLTAIDLDVQRLPDRIVYPSLVVGAVLTTAAALVGGDLGRLATAGVGAAAAFVLFFLIAFAVPGGMGMGDVKLAAVLGLFLGYFGIAQLVVGIAAGFVLGGLFGIVVMIVRRAEKRRGIPFGPWMFAGAWTGILAGGPIAGTYLSLVGLN